MKEKESLKAILRSAIALQGAMRESVASAVGEHANVGKYASFKTFMRKYNIVVGDAVPFLTGSRLLDKYDVSKLKDSGYYTWPQQKELFDNVFANVAMLRSVLENRIGFAEDETIALANFLQVNLRRTMFSKPDKEVEVQNAIESLLIGRGLTKGSEYDRETGRVKVSGKESIPDFVFRELSLCLEVKLVKSREDLRRVIDEINADVRCYSTVYERQLYVVYDISTIRNEAEFKKDIESANGVSVIVVKH